MDPSCSLLPVHPLPRVGAWRCTPCPLAPSTWVDMSAEGCHSPTDLENETLTASIKTLLGTCSEVHLRSELRGQWATKPMDSLSCSQPETEVLELLPSLPERSHVTLGTSILASANSFHGQKNGAQAPGAPGGDYPRQPWAPAWVSGWPPPLRPGAPV